MISDEEFFADRAQHERSAAREASDITTERLHLELARDFEELRAALEAAHKPTLEPVA